VWYDLDGFFKRGFFMTLIDISKEVDKLEMSEKLLLVEDIWDSIALNNAELPISNQQKQELDQRYLNFKERNSKTWQDFFENPQFPTEDFMSK
jgi:putative addiction module component (TIGR02574 family)